MHTPAFDALAKKSLVLFKNYVQQAVCVQIAIDLVPAVVHHCFVFVFVWFGLAFTEQLPPEHVSLRGCCRAARATLVFWFSMSTLHDCNAVPCCSAAHLHLG